MRNNHFSMISLSVLYKFPTMTYGVENKFIIIGDTVSESSLASFLKWSNEMNDATHLSSNNFQIVNRLIYAAFDCGLLR